MPAGGNRIREMVKSLENKRVLLVIAGGIAAYKSLDLIRRLRERGAAVTPVMTRAAHEFVTPLAVGALAAAHVFTDLFSREDEQDVGHIRLARDCDLVLVAPATADLMAKMANGLADDLAIRRTAGGAGPGAGRARHEPGDVGASGHVPQSCDARGRRRPLRWTRRAAKWPRAARRALGA